MVLRCWEEDAVSLDGNYYKAPYPLDTGVQKYPAARIASEAGGKGEIDDKGNVRRISVVPPPYRTRRPPIFVATSKSDDSVRYCGRMGFHPTYFSKFDGHRSATRRSSTSRRPTRSASASRSGSGRTSCAGPTSPPAWRSATR